eukprot:CAMPEP_0117439206 /NCGR_PEP_ID=MMETSP0759-20121206/2448_1 /TAXON_ID=63605 /ORGANISM="Percolomonas cosmopolitus, Strain WS" /LENGTH=346 /DNA_ID=CAMNT_0005230919 /DNA_START=382 /DNA_END=1419 /DNA_ORIENTATION=-
MPLKGSTESDEPPVSNASQQRNLERTEAASSGADCNTTNHSQSFSNELTLSNDAQNEQPSALRSPGRARRLFGRLCASSGGVTTRTASSSQHLPFTNLFSGNHARRSTVNVDSHSESQRNQHSLKSSEHGISAAEENVPKYGHSLFSDQISQNAQNMPNPTPDTLFSRSTIPSTGPTSDDGETSPVGREWARPVKQLSQSITNNESHVHSSANSTRIHDPSSSNPSSDIPHNFEQSSRVNTSPPPMYIVTKQRRTNQNFLLALSSMLILMCSIALLVFSVYISSSFLFDVAVVITGEEDSYVSEGNPLIRAVDICLFLASLFGLLVSMLGTTVSVMASRPIVRPKW